MCKYQYETLKITTITTQKVRIWNALTGHLMQEFFGIRNSAITAACFDRYARRLFLGFDSGKVAIFNATNGALIRYMSSHNDEVTSLHYSVEHSVLVSASKNGILHLHSDDPSLQQTLKSFFVIFLFFLLFFVSQNYQQKMTHVTSVSVTSQKQKCNSIANTSQGYT